MPFSLRNLTKSKIPSLPFSMIAQKVLGENFDLSLVVCGNVLSAKLNLRRGKSSPTNVLAFSLGRESGEIFLNGDKIRRETRLFGKTLRNHWFDIYLHSLFHLAGYKHGRKMDQAVHKFTTHLTQGV